MATTKALLIKSYTTISTGLQGQWNPLDQATSYIHGIETGDLLKDASADSIAALISGVPTPWARAKLFKFAFDTLSSPDPNVDTSGLQQYYEMLFAEWKGLMALMALYPDRITFSAPVTMDTRGEDYNLASAFGRMLFDDRDLWSDQTALAKNPDAQPFIQLIYYKDHLLGGTSPLTGIFTGVRYDLGSDANDIPWYRNGKLEDPLRTLSPANKQKLYLFVKNFNNNLDAFSQMVNSCRQNNKLDLRGFTGLCRNWETEVKNSQQGLKERGPVTTFNNLSCPFATLFHSDVPVYMKADRTFTYVNDGNSIRIGDIQELLSKDPCVVGWTEKSTEKMKLSDAPVYFLQVDNLQTNDKYYFSLPLSETGIDIFKNDLASLLGYGATGKSSLRGTVDDTTGTLSVTMTVEIDGESVTLNTKEYAIDWVTCIDHVILWPNFVSDNWNKYYLYSQFVSGAKEQFTPIFKSHGEILRDGDGHFLTPDYQYQPNEDPLVTIKRLITYPVGIGEENLKYNILCTDKPIEGLRVKVKVSANYEGGGYLMLRHTVVKDLSSVTKNDSAVVGVDFGSNNTCVYYSTSQQGALPITFDNYRTVLVGRENIDPYANASNDELLFFTNHIAKNGQFKSWLHEHDTRYNVYNQSEEVAGGVPVNRPNVVVREMNEYCITTQAGTLHYNMKWLDDDRGRQKKRAFLKSLWLQTCAYLYTKRLYPTELRWSHPGAMMDYDVTEYEKIFHEVVKSTPIANCRLQLSEDRPTEAEAVCSYALSQNFGVTNNNIFLGLDVGGSTSDILLLAKNPKDNAISLFRESSVRIASGVFFNAVTESKLFREALVTFHESNTNKIHITNIKDLRQDKDKAPYFLNNVFDQLKDNDDYDTLYNAIYDEAKFVFTIPAYVTGLLLFYSGMLIGKVIKEHNLASVTKVDILSFGKGGRIFHWLPATVTTRKANEYYAACVNAGVSVVVDRQLTVRYRDEIAVDNKAEVAKGLCDQKDIVTLQAHNDTDICGESGVKFFGGDGGMRALAVEDELSGDYFDDNMGKFDFADISNFKLFMDIFFDFVSKKTQLYPYAERDLREELSDLPARIASYISNNDTEYKKARREAQQQGTFHYHQPIIIAEGICFLSTLIKKAFNQ